MATPSWAGQGPWGWLVALHDLGWQVGAPGPLSPHHLVSWLESWASLTRLCTSISVLSLVPERSFSAPICSRTVERCSAVHFRTKGFRWLEKKKKNTIPVKGLAQSRNRGPTVVPPCSTP